MILKIIKNRNQKKDLNSKIKKQITNNFIRTKKMLKTKEIDKLNNQNTNN